MLRDRYFQLSIAAACILGAAHAYILCGFPLPRVEGVRFGALLFMASLLVPAFIFGKHYDVPLGIAFVSYTVISVVFGLALWLWGVLDIDSWVLDDAFRFVHNAVSLSTNAQCAFMTAWMVGCCFLAAVTRPAVSETAV